MKNLKLISEELNIETMQDLEYKVSSIVIGIIDELEQGKNNLLNTLEYFICGDPTPMKLYELKSVLLQKALEKIPSYKLASLWLETKEGSNHENFNSLKYDIYDVYTYSLSIVDFYKGTEYTDEYFLELLDRQCWLQTEIIECNKLYSELLSLAEDTEKVNIFIPSSLTSIESMQFYSIFAIDISNIDNQKYITYIILKLTFLLQQEEVNTTLISELNNTFENFKEINDNPIFYLNLPPIYFAKKIIESEAFLKTSILEKNKEIHLDNIHSSKIFATLEENNYNTEISLEKIITTTIYDIINFVSEFKYQENPTNESVEDTYETEENIYIDIYEVKILLHRILSIYVEIDKKTFSLLSNIKLLFKDSTQDFLSDYEALDTINNTITDLYNDLHKNASYRPIYEYVISLQKAIQQLSSITYKLYQKSNNINYPKDDYNKDIKLYSTYKNAYLFQASAVNKFFNK